MKLIPNFAGILLLSFLATNCSSKKEVKISSFYVVNYVHTLFANSKTYYYRQDNFLVENYIENSDSFAKIKEFACKNKHKKSSEYDNYQMTFYRKNKITNNDYTALRQVLCMRIEATPLKHREILHNLCTKLGGGQYIYSKIGNSLIDTLWSMIIYAHLHGVVNLDPERLWYAS